MNYFRGSVWFVVLILVIIAVAFILSILPQEIRWILFIISIACIVIQLAFSITYNAYDFPMNNPSAVSFPPLFEIYRMNGNLTKADLYPKSDQLS